MIPGNGAFDPPFCLPAGCGKRSPFQSAAGGLPQRKGNQKKTAGRNIAALKETRSARRFK